MVIRYVSGRYVRVKNLGTTNYSRSSAPEKYDHPGLQAPHNFFFWEKDDRRVSWLVMVTFFYPV